MRRTRWVCGWLVAAALAAGCDDPVPGPVGGVVLVFRTTGSADGTKQDDVANLTVRLASVWAIVDGQKVMVDSQERVLSLDNETADVLVGQYQVPAGTLEQFRLFASEVTITERDGDVITLVPGTSDLPSWENSGWKIVPAEGETFPVVVDELSGVRALFRFDDRLVLTGAGESGWKVKPTVEAEAFDPNPAAQGPGVQIDAFTWVVKPGVTPAEVTAIATSLGCTVERYPVLTRWYRIGLPVTLNLEQAEAAFAPLAETEHLLPAVNYALTTVTANDGGQAAEAAANTTEGWCDANASDPNGFVGSHAVRVAVIEGPIDVTHPDLRRNIGIKQAELPLGLYDDDGDGTIEATEIAAHDCDPDGVITIRDLECDGVAAPPDVNGNGQVDAQDVVRDPNWSDNVDDDGNGMVDDLCGWDFFGNDNDPSHDGITVGDWHATFVSGIIGAEGNNGLGMAGVNWRVSIVPIQAGLLNATSGEFYAPHETTTDAFAYIEAEGIDVANMSMGWLFESEDGDDDRGCGDEGHPQVTKGIDAEDYDAGVADWQNALGAVFGAAGTTMYAISAGNSSYDVTSGENFSVPFEAMFADADVANRTLAVGALNTAGTRKVDFSGYGTPVEIYAPGSQYTSLIPVPDTCGDTTGCSQYGCPGDGGSLVCQSDGTSFSSPTVAGAAALLAATDATVAGDGAALKSAILATADVVGDLVECDGDTSAGNRLDIGALVP